MRLRTRPALRALRPLLALSTLLISSALAPAAITLPPMFGDHMVLQRGMEVPVWGSAAPGEKVTIDYAGKSATATADEKGEWKAKLPSLGPGDAASLTVKGDKSEPVTFSDVLVGDVWICSGQSNMQMTVGQSKDAQQEIDAATFPNIRLFRVPMKTALKPTTQLSDVKWEMCSPTTVGPFSAVGYFFGREIHQREKVPVGLIQNPWGGMPAESFTSDETLRADPDFAPLLARKAEAGGGDTINDKELRTRVESAQKRYQKAKAEWDAKYQKTDEGNKGFDQGWAKSDFDDAEWKTMPLPSHWEDHGLKIDGAVWFRRTVDVPSDWKGKPLVLTLGGIDDTDTTYVNGQQVGKTEGELAVLVARKYDVPAELTRTGKTTIAVRAFDRGGPGGFYGPEVAMKLAPKGDESAKPIALAGEWKYQVEKGYEQPDKIPPPPAAPPQADAPYLASNIYNAMVHPLIPYAIKGAIWYQGESNAGRAEQYRKLFPAMIADWRQHWGQGDFPFLFVQLANYGNGHEREAQPGDSTWAELREAQSMTLTKSPHTGMAVIIDIGESKDIHPKNKQDVGKRLALQAETRAYGKTGIEDSGPVYESMTVEGDKVRLKFTHADGLVLKPGKAFAVAGEDQKFHWADAKVEGDEVVLASDEVKKPVAVRYAWSDDPDAILFNGAALPASPFRTDDWKMVTAGAK